MFCKYILILSTLFGSDNLPDLFVSYRRTLLKAEVESETLDNKQSSGEMSYEMESLLKENDLWNIKSASIRFVHYYVIMIHYDAITSGQLNNTLNLSLYI